LFRLVGSSQFEALASEGQAFACVAQNLRKRPRGGGTQEIGVYLAVSLVTTGGGGTAFVANTSTLEVLSLIIACGS
jgi:hypothetical protein